MTTTRSSARRHRLDNCWLERWRTTAIDDGARALLTLQHGVAAALQHLGTGFVVPPRQHRAARNPGRRHRRRPRPAPRAAAHRLPADRAVRRRRPRSAAHRHRRPRAPATCTRDYFSTARLRTLAANHAGGRHTDLWEAHQIVTDALAGDGLPALGLSGLGATLFSRDALSILDGARLPNRAFLAAVRALSQIDDPITGTPRPVDYRNLDSEELGGMYEGLLAYTPRYHADERTFTLDIATGNDRKKSGSYYTPSDLIALVLDEALDPLIDEALRAPDPEQALLALTVVDPACGSGHFVVAAARRIASALATVRTGDTEPSPAAPTRRHRRRHRTLRLRRRPQRPGHRDHQGRAVARSLRRRPPVPVPRRPLPRRQRTAGHHPGAAAQQHPRHRVRGPRRRRQGLDRQAQGPQQGRTRSQRRPARRSTSAPRPSTSRPPSSPRPRATPTPAPPAPSPRMRARADAWRTLEADPDLVAAKLVADAWCAAFVQPKTNDRDRT